MKASLPSDTATKQDVKDLKTDLKKLEERLDEKFDKKLDTRLKENNIILKLDLKEYIDERLYAFENRINFKFDKLFTRIDPLLGEIETAREDRVITTNNISQLQKTSKDHGVRIRKVEVAIKTT